MARDRRERQRRTHAMPRKHAALNGEVAHHSSGSRHTAHRQADTSLITKASRNAPALRRRVSLTLRPDRSPKLAGGEIAPDAPAWQIMIRGAQTPAFSAAVTFGLVLTWLGTEAPPHSSQCTQPVPSCPAGDAASCRAGNAAHSSAHRAGPRQGKSQPWCRTDDERSFTDQSGHQPESLRHARTGIGRTRSTGAATTAPPKSKPLPDSARAQPPNAPLSKTAPTDPAREPAIQHPNGARPGPPPA